MNAALTEGQRLAREAAEAAEIRDWQDHPDVVALRVEKVRARIDAMMWAGIVLGLLFTMTSVQQFAVTAMGVGVGSLGWWAAWLLDPTVAVILIAILLAERQVAPARMLLGMRSRLAKWGLLAATYVMNTWESWSAGSAAGIVLHSVPVLAVFAAAESVTDCQDKLTAYVQWAHGVATDRAQRTATGQSAAMYAEFDVDAGLDDGYARAGLERPKSAPEYPVAPPVPPGATGAPTLTPVAPGSRTRPTRGAVGVPAGPSQRPSPVPITDELLARARAIRARQLSQGRTAGRMVLQRELGVPERVAKELIRRLGDPPLHVVSGGPS